MAIVPPSWSRRTMTRESLSSPSSRSLSPSHADEAMARANSPTLLPQLRAENSHWRLVGLSDGVYSCQGLERAGMSSSITGCRGLSSRCAGKRVPSFDSGEWASRLPGRSELSSAGPLEL
jgi:hypothetical protein